MQIGDKVYLLEVMRNGRNVNCNISDLKEYYIKKIGRKYIEVWDKERDWHSLKFDMTDNFRQATQYTPDWELYFSQQDYSDIVEKKEISRFIYQKFEYGKDAGLSLEQLRKIKAIIEE